MSYIKNNDDLPFKLSPIEELVLLTLESGEELYGKQIVDVIEKATEGKFVVPVGTLYPILRHFNEKGLAKARWGDESPTIASAARRRYYKITSEGTRILTEREQIRQRIAEGARTIRVLELALS